MSVGEKSVRRAKDVIKKAIPEVIEAVERGEIRVNTAARIADAPADQQKAALFQQVFGANAQGFGDTFQPIQADVFIAAVFQITPRLAVSAHACALSGGSLR